MMSNNKGIALIIISLVVGATGVGLGAYSIIKYEVIQGPAGPQGLPGEPGSDGADGVDGIDGINGTFLNPAGIWESVTGSGIVFNLSLGDIRLNRSGFFTLDEYNETITLIKLGWYKFNVRIRLTGLTSTADYYVTLIGYTLEYLDNIPYPQDTTYFVNAFGYIYSDGNDYFILHCYNYDGDSFSVDLDQGFNQVVLEYVGEL